MPIIAFVNEKRGTGKTTSSINLAIGLVKLEQNCNSKILLVTLEPKTDGTEGFSRGWNSLIRDSINFKVVGKDWKNLKKYPKSLSACRNIYQATFPSSFDLSKKPSKLHYIPLKGTEGLPSFVSYADMNVCLLKEQITSVINEFKYIIIDAPPSNPYLSKAALVAATHYIIPTKLDGVSNLTHIDKMLRMAKSVRRKLNPNLKLLGILPVNKDIRSSTTILVYKELIENFDNTLFTQIGRNPDTVAYIVKEINKLENNSFSESMKSAFQFDTNPENERFTSEVIQRLLIN